MNKDQKAFLSLIRKIEKSGGPSAVKSFLASEGKEIPTIKLNNSEMVALKGGQSNGSSRWSPLGLAYDDGGINELASQFAGGTINPPFP